MPRTARAWSPRGAAPFEIFPTRPQIRTLYAAGCTILFEHVQSFVPALQPLCTNLAADLGLARGAVVVQALLDLTGGQARTHFDSGFTINCQIQGTKVWRFAPNHGRRFASFATFLGRYPPREAEHLVAKPVHEPLHMSEAFVAQPGSVVFLPPGVIHTTRTQSASLAVGFSIDPADRVADLIAARIEKELEKVAELCTPLVGARRRALDGEAPRVVAELRRLADTVENAGGSWWARGADHRAGRGQQTRSRLMECGRDDD